ncbi:ABC transporter substrate-binding protein [Pseudoalteromonas mariniglutinosa]|uniref:ABC transporter substrate-binding protein n=1 Tax=Pseudoalteromonas mariniglutinosa TaxID=206042 RepID=UPI0038501792
MIKQKHLSKHRLGTLAAVYAILTATYTHPANSAEQLSITWMENDSEPFYIANSASASQGGLCSKVTDLLINALPDIKHHRVVLPQKRVGKYMDEGHLACFSCMIHRDHPTSRATYSIPTTVYPPFVILTNQQNRAAITQQHGDPVSLVSLFTDANFIFGQNTARKYGSKMDMIAKNTKLLEGAALSSNGSHANHAILSQIEHGYIDYAIDYPFVADYYNNKNQRKITKLKIAKPEQTVLLGAIGCSSSAPNNFAKKALKKINHALQEQVLPSEQYQQNQLFWLGQSFPEFNKYYQQLVLEPLNLPANDESVKRLQPL